MISSINQLAFIEDTLNRFELTLHFGHEYQVGKEDKEAYRDEMLLIDAVNLHPVLRQFQCDESRLFIAGNPIIDGQRNDDTVVRAFEGSTSVSEFALRINGSFLILIYDKQSRSLYVINDRFASIAFYYVSIDGQLVASTSLKRIHEILRCKANQQINPEAVFEFIYFRRLFGEKTLDTKTSYLTSAAILSITVGSSKPSIEKYWSPDYQKVAPKGRALIHAIADSLQHAVRIHMSDEHRFALMLSGGLDSRAVLAAAKKLPVCFTTSLKHNNEVEVAEEVAQYLGIPHFYIPRPANIYDTVVDDSIFLTGGMQVYTETEFMGYGPQVLPQADSVLTGLGLDIFLTGLYLPKSTVTIFKRPALHYVLNPLQDDLTGQFIEQVKYRLRTSNAFSVVKEKHRRSFMESLRTSVDAVMCNGHDLGARGYDLWEYMHTHNLSRHYSFPMMSSVRTYTDCRSPALENGLFDLAIAMDARDKVNGTAYQDALRRLNPGLMSIRNANTNLSAGISLPVQSLVKAALFAANRIFKTPYPVSPGWQDRSWPSAYESLISSPSILKMLHELPRSEYLASLDFIDMDNVSKILQEHHTRRHDHSVLLNLLLTVERFIRPSGISTMDNTV